MGYSMRLELTPVFSINDSCLVEFVFIGGFVPLLGVCLLWSSLPFFDI